MKTSPHLQFAVYATLVVLFFYATFIFFLPQGLGEERDRWIHVSLPIIFELSFLITLAIKGHCGLFDIDSRICQVVPARFRSKIFELIGLSPVLGGCCFAWYGYYAAAISIAAVVAVYLHEWAWRRFSRYHAVKVAQYVIALVIIIGLFKAQVLNGDKDRHHWSFYLGPLYGVLGGGQMLWDVPSQYGLGVILLPAWIARIFNLAGIDALVLISATFAFVSTSFLFYFFTFTVGLSPILGSVSSCVFSLFFVGWLPDLIGPIAYPSVSGLRFLPSFLALLCTSRAINSEKQGQAKWIVIAAISSALAFIWSSESFLYVACSLCAYIGFRALTDFNFNFLRAPAFTAGVSGLAVALLFIGLYGLINGSPIDLLGFYEYALMYASYFGTLPINFDEFTIFYIFALSFSFFFARIGMSWSDRRTWTGLILVAYLWLVSSYYVARSHPNNVKNLTTWALLVMCASISSALSPQLRTLHRAGISLVCALGLSYLIQATTGANSRLLVGRLTTDSWWRGPSLSGIAQPLKNVIVTQPHVTYLVHNESADLLEPPNYSGNTAGLSPLRHFMILPEQRRCEYLRRMTERRGGMTIIVDPGALGPFSSMLKSCASKVSWKVAPDLSGYKVYRLGGAS